MTENNRRKQEILDLVAKIKKPSKKYIYEMINEVIDGKINIEKKELAKLKAFFLPAIQKLKVRNDIEFCQIACCKSEVREYITKIYNLDGVIYATDGHRCHFVDDINIKNNSYINKDGEAINFDATFPDIKRIIPADKQEFKHNINIDDCKIELTETSCKVINLLNDSWFKLEYVLQALQGATEITAYHKGNNEPILFKNINGTKRNAVILPIKHISGE